MRIAVTSSPFPRALASRELTQLEWLERCASALGVDGVVPALASFPRRDDEYVAQLRKVAIDLGLVPLGIDVPDLFAAESDPAEAIAVAQRFGAAVVRTRLPAPGDVPPAAFVEAVGRAKAAVRTAKAANVTLVVAAEAGTLAEDLGGVKHLLKDVDSAWLRAAPRITDLAAGSAPKDRFPLLLATPADEPPAVAAVGARAWVLLDAPAAERPWDLVGDALEALRIAEAERRLAAG